MLQEPTELQPGGTGAVQLQPAWQGAGTGSTARRAVLRQLGSTGRLRAGLGLLGMVGRVVLLVRTGSTVHPSTVGLLGLLLLLVGLVRHPHTLPRGSTVRYRLLLLLLHWRLGQVRRQYCFDCGEGRGGGCTSHVWCAK
jgi:hypothetical protein